MKKTTLAIALIITVLAIVSCSRSITPYEAAHGKAACGRTIR